MRIYHQPGGRRNAAQRIPSVLRPTPSHPSYVPQRVYDTQAQAFHRFRDRCSRDVSGADVLFLGEQHDDPATHRLEAATLEGLARRRGNIVLAMEMFERDVQPSLDDYLSGRSTETEFLAESRALAALRHRLPSARRVRARLEMARGRERRAAPARQPRVAPRPQDHPGLDQRRRTARSRRAISCCPHDDYFGKFAKTMADMPSHSGDSTKESAAERAAMIERIYQAQCIKDETMGESVATRSPPRRRARWSCTSTARSTATTAWAPPSA